MKMSVSPNSLKTSLGLVYILNSRLEMYLRVKNVSDIPGGIEYVGDLS